MDAYITGLQITIAVMGIMLALLIPALFIINKAGNELSKEYDGLEAMSDGWRERAMKYQRKYLAELTTSMEWANIAGVWHAAWLDEQKLKSAKDTSLLPKR